MIWNDAKVKEMTDLKSLGLSTAEAAKRMGCPVNALYGKLRRIRQGSLTHTKPANGKTERFSSKAVGKSPRAVTETYKVFIVTNVDTNVKFKLAGMGHELPDKTLKSTIIGEIRRKFHKKLKQTFEYERIM